jgi:hypothetical protein
VPPLTEETIKRFEKYLEEEETRLKTRSKKVGYNKILLKGILKIIWPDVLEQVVLITISEGSAVFYSYFIKYIIAFIRDEVAPVSQGIKLIVLFFFSQLVGQTMRGRYMFGGWHLSIKVRRLLVAGLYNKVVRLSVKSMTETNSGKLVSLISADLFQIERGLSTVPVLLASPFINLLAYYLMA